jgi:ankyrin repeat protein
MPGASFITRRAGAPAPAFTHRLAPSTRRAGASAPAFQRSRPRRLKPALYAIALSVLATGAAPAGHPLIDAARNADAGAVRRLVQEKADVNAAEGDGTTALHWASYRDDGESADLLINAGANVNAANDLGATPLWTASLNGSAAMVRRLLHAGADANAALLLGETPLMVAARSGNPDVVEQLLERGANVNARAARGQTALMWAVAQKHPDVVKVLLAHRADVHARSESWSQVEAVSPHGHPDYNRAITYGNNTPLMFAARVGDLASAKLLVAGGANVNDEDARGVSVVTLAAHSGFLDVVEFLLDNGGDPNASGAGFMALHEAIMRRDEPLVRTLLAHGADPQARLQTWTPTRRQSSDFHFEPELVGATPYWLAARFWQPNVMRLLVELGADPLFVHRSDRVVDGKEGRAYEHRYDATTALMAALGMGGGGNAWVQPDRSRREALALDTVKLAVDLGIDVNATNTDGRTALDAAKALKYETVVTYLESKGARPGVTEKTEKKDQ